MTNGIGRRRSPGRAQVWRRASPRIRSIRPLLQDMGEVRVPLLKARGVLVRCNSHIAWPTVPSALERMEELGGTNNEWDSRWNAAKGSRGKLVVSCSSILL